MTTLRGTVQGDADEIGGRLFQQIERVQQMAANTRRWTGGSQTAERLAQQRDDRYGMSMLASVAADLAGGGGVFTGGNLVRKGLSAASDRFAASRNAATGGHVLNRVGATDLAGVQRNMAALAARAAQTQNPEARAVVGARAALLGGAVAGPYGTTAGDARSGSTIDGLAAEALRRRS